MQLVYNIFGKTVGFMFYKLINLVKNHIQNKNEYVYTDSELNTINTYLFNILSYIALKYHINIQQTSKSKIVSLNIIIGLFTILSILAEKNILKHDQVTYILPYSENFKLHKDNYSYNVLIDH